MTTTNIRNRWSRGQQIFVGCLLAGLVVAAIEAASVFDDECGWSFLNELAVTVKNDGRDRFEIRQGRCRLIVKLQGDVTFNDDESGVAHLTPGSRLTIDDRDRKGRRHLDVRPAADGSPIYSWTLDGEERAFDAQAQGWLRDVLPHIFRLTGIDAERRVARFLKNQGVDGVLAEVELVRGDRLQRLYLDQLLDQATLTSDELASALETAGEVIGTDHELRQWLGRINAAELATPEARRAYGQATASIGTDHEMRQALAKLLHSDGVDRQVLALLLEVATGIGTDHEMAELLIDVASTWPDDQALPEELVAAVETIGTDSDQRRTLAAFFARPGISDEELDVLLGTAPQIGTDHDLSRLLADLATSLPADRVPPTSFFAALDTVGTDADHRRVLSAVVARSELPAPAIEAVLDSALSIGTDSDLAPLLIELASAHGLDAQLEPALERALATLGTSERQRVEQALGRVEAAQS